MLLKIGALARHAGLSVRALHHYDAIGLLSPSARSDTGLRLYGPKDLVRLHRIQALKQLGYSLADIGATLADPAIASLEIIGRQIGMLQERERQARALGERLRQLAAHIGRGGQAADADWLDVLEMMTLYQKHFSEAEVTALRGAAGSGATEGAARRTQAQWARLVASAGQAMRQGVPAASARARALAWRWVRGVIALTGNDPVLAGKLMALQESEARAQDITGISPALLDWVGQAVAQARGALFARHLSPADSAQVLARQCATMGRMTAWPALVAQVREQMRIGTPPGAPPAQALARRWRQLFRDTHCGPDRALEARVRAVFPLEPDLLLGVGVDAALLDYARQAMTHLRPGPPRKPAPHRP